MNQMSLFDKSTQECAALAISICERYGNKIVDVEHVMLAILEHENNQVVEILESTGIDIDGLKAYLDQVLVSYEIEPSIMEGQVIYISPALEKVIKIASDISISQKVKTISTSYLFLAILKDEESLTAHGLIGSGVVMKEVQALIINSDNLANSKEPQ